MRIALVVLVAVVGITLTLFAAARMWQANRRGDARELVVGYLALMIAASAASLLLLRAL